MMKKLFVVTLLASTLVLTGCSRTAKKTDDVIMKKDESMMKDDMMKKDNHAMMMGTGGTGEWTKDEMEAMEKDKIMDKESMMKTDDIMMKKEGAMYKSYDSATVGDALKAGKKVALFFHASRCPGCRALDKDLTAGLSTLPTNTVVFKVDYDTATDLKKKYGVTSQHTIVSLNADMSATSKTVGTTLDGVIKQLQ